MSIVFDASRRVQWFWRGLLLVETTVFVVAAASCAGSELLGFGAILSLILWVPSCILAFAPRENRVAEQ